MGEDSKEGVMVDSVESFLEVKEEQEVEAILLFGRVEGVVDRVDVRSNVATFDECLLVGKKEAVDCTHYVVSEGGCNDAIVCIGDGDWAGLVYVHLGVLGDEVEKSMVEAVWGRGPCTKSPDDPEKDGGSVLGESSVEREVEAVWAWARVSRAGDGSCNRGERRGRQVGKPARVVS